MFLKNKKMLTRISVAVALALGASGAMAGVVDNSNNLAGVLGDCGTAAGDTVACIGAWNLDNVQVNLFKADGSAQLSPPFDPVTGIYPTMQANDYVVSSIFAGAPGASSLMATMTSKVWPIGEPTGIKAVNGDTLVKNGKPQNCLINTAFLEGHYLDSATPQPVICSSDFQSHKRFKVAMQPASVDAVTSGDGHPIDLVFNSTDNSFITPYQVFSKINNYTDKRLSGYKIEVGVGTGSAFKTATDLGISNQLYLSLGIGEDATSTPVGADLFTVSDGLATFSHGLFGAMEPPRFPSDGFFSNTTAYYPVTQSCTTAGVDATCPNNVTVASSAIIPASDTIYSSGVVSANYSNFFGAWLPSDWAPEGIFYDDDSDPATDPKLVAWWNGNQWMMQSKDVTGNPIYDASGNAVFIPVPSDVFASWAADPLYAEDVIEDVLNLGINYIVHVGDINGITGTGTFAGSSNFTVRIIPLVAADQTAPTWAGTTPTPLVVTPTPTPAPAPAPTPAPATTSSSGGGCTIGGDGHFDPTFPALLLAGLGFFGLRRFSRKS